MINYGLTMHGVDRGGGMVKGSVDEGSVVGSEGEGSEEDRVQDVNLEIMSLPLRKAIVANG